MKRILFLAILAALLLPGCHFQTQPTEDSSPAATAPAIKTGWTQENGVRYYYLSDGTLARNWQTIDGKRYFFAPDGSPVTGWMGVDDGMHFFGADGVMRTGWVEDGGNHYYLNDTGLLQTGWQEIDGKRYYLGTDGARYSGWLTQQNIRYYLKPDGSMARGKCSIDGKDRYFTASGAEIILANPWNTIPDDFKAQVAPLDASISVEGKFGSVLCMDQLEKMIGDCNKVHPTAIVLSAYRSHQYQIGNFNRKVKFYLDRGYSQKEAEIEAAKVVAVPGTSEHELGLAFDIIDTRHWGLTEKQAELPAQKWLMENCWKYGFILRYPKGRFDSTGIIFEPWHYRYVGMEVAETIHETGQTLEEYLSALSETQKTAGSSSRP